MAHFAEIDENGVVLRVIVVNNKDTADVNGVEKEYIGAAFCEKLFGGTWKQTSYNHNFRKHYAGIGFTWREDLNAFIPPKPHLSWVLNETTCVWDPPVPMPTDADPMGGRRYIWKEEIQNWVLDDLS